jgi:hypothetical protein
MSNFLDNSRVVYLSDFQADYVGFAIVGHAICHRRAHAMATHTVCSYCSYCIWHFIVSSSILGAQ